MRGEYPIRRRRLNGLRGLGAPILPDQIITASGQPWSFSPGTADAIMMSVLQSAGQQLPADLAAKWAAAQSAPTTATPAATTAAVTASGAAISTQTAQAVTLLDVMAVQNAPGVFKCLMSDGSSHYCNSATQPISYTPPAPTPAVTPAASVPTATVAPAVTPVPQTGVTIPATPVIAVTPSGATINSTTGQPSTLPPTPVSADTLDSVVSWLEASLLFGIPNWVLLAGAGLFLFSSGNGGSRRR